MVPPLAKVEPAEDGPVRIVRVSGELDMDNSDDVCETLLELVPDEAPGLVADLSELRYIDSAGIRLFVELADRLGRNRQKLALVVPEGAAISHVFSLVKLELIVPVHPSVSTAVASMTAGTEE